MFLSEISEKNKELIRFNFLEWKLMIRKKRIKSIMERNKIIQISYAVIYNIIFLYLAFFGRKDNSPDEGYMWLIKLSVFFIFALPFFLLTRDNFPYDFSVDQKRFLVFFSTPLFPIFLGFILPFFSPVFEFWANR